MNDNVIKIKYDIKTVRTDGKINIQVLTDKIIQNYVLELEEDIFLNICNNMSDDELLTLERVVSDELAIRGNKE